MADFTFDSERTCPKCSANFQQAPQKVEYEPVIVVSCPDCGAILWRPGSEETSPLFPYDPDADAGGL